MILITQACALRVVGSSVLHPALIGSITTSLPGVEIHKETVQHQTEMAPYPPHTHMQ